MKVLSRALQHSLLLLCCIQFAFAASISTEIDSSRIVAGESFQVFFTMHGQQTAVTPNFTRLKNDFSIMGVSNNIEMTVLNGRASSITTWALTLIPKKDGELVIPSIQFGKLSSKPLKVSVYPASKVAAKNRNTSRTRLRATLSNNKPYVQSQVNYRVQLFFTRDIAEGKLTDPEAENSLIIKMGNDKRYKTTYKGRPYYVLERDYAIIPQKSGKITIKPPRFDGYEYLPNDYRNGLSTMVTTRGQRIRLRAQRLSMWVRRIPRAARKGDWLPAKSFRIQESWSLKGDTIKLGEPLNRTVILQAEGLTAEQLPDIDDSGVENASVYPDKPVVLNSVKEETIIGQRKEKVAYIPKKPGTLTIPGVKIKWWNTKTRQLETAELPSKVIKVIQDTPAAAAATPKPSAPSAQNQMPVQQQPVTTQNPTSSVERAIDSHTWWPWISGLLLFAWAGTMGALVIQRRQKQTVPTKEPTQETEKLSFRRIRMELKHSCSHNDAKRTRELILKWAILQWPNQDNFTLGHIIGKIKDPEFSAALKDLNRALYAKSSYKWEGEALWLAFSQYKEHKQQESENSEPLPPLNYD